MKPLKPYMLKRWRIAEQASLLHVCSAWKDR